MIWSLLAGALPVLAFPRPDLGWLAWAALVPGLLLLRAAPSSRQALRRGWCFGTGYLLAALSWTAPSIGPGLLAVAAVFGAPWALWGAAARACRGWEALLVLPAGWVAAEYLRSWHGFGGPWALYGTSQWRSPEVLALASVGGVWLVSFALVLVNTALALALSRFDRRVLLVLPAVALALPAAWWAGGGGEQGREWRAALVQPGVVDDPAERFAAGERITAGITGADLVVWGESSVGTDLSRAPGLRGRLAPLGTLLVNEDARDARGRISKSSVLLVDGVERGRYVKTRLVPFGEYIPLRPAFGWLTKISRAASEDRVPGTGSAVLDVRGMPVAPVICFESAFPDLGRAAVDGGARVIVIQSSTSTFQESWAPPQHAALAAVRAAETGRPVVQAALTGVSAAFDSRGRRLAWLDTDRRGAATAALRPPGAGTRTLYTRLGDAVPLLCLLLVAGLGVRPVAEKSMRAR
ncbi:apolipoprotein N-acyltransferase [Actinocorallia populi]|uniref:apolipoprotein N-acyltransferase n=1 Tax=Actinocorallia populi TaxID=2079200 RepID=UPI00130064F9|nr:apolipoprotein N-acyltransferase [Actinocorallia populi]